MLYRNSDVIFTKTPFSSIAVVYAVTFWDGHFVYDLNINGMHYRGINESDIDKLISRKLSETEMNFYLELLATYLKNNDIQRANNVKNILIGSRKRKIDYNSFNNLQ